MVAPCARRFFKYGTAPAPLHHWGTFERYQLPYGCALSFVDRIDDAVKDFLRLPALLFLPDRCAMVLITSESFPPLSQGMKPRGSLSSVSSANMRNRSMAVCIRSVSPNRVVSFRIGSFELINGILKIS